MNKISRTYTSQQIEEAICRWSRYLLENKLATDTEVMDVIGESWFKRAKTGIKNAVKGIGKSIASGVKAVGREIHDFFTANKGVSQLMDAVNMLWIDGSGDKDAEKSIKVKENKYAGKLKPEKIKFMLFDGSKVYPVVKFVLSKNKKALAALYDKENSPCATYEQLKKLLEDNKVSGKGRHVTDFVDALVIGKLEDNKARVSESEVILEYDEFSRIDAVVDAMQWSKKTAMTSKNIAKLASLLGIKEKDLDEVKARVKSHFDSERFDFGEEDSEEDAESSKEEKKDVKNKDVKKKDDGKAEDKKSFDSSKNDYSIETSDKQTIGVKDNQFKRVEVDGSYIGLIFDKSKKELKDIEDTRASLKH